jgi:hypothetical protein
MTEDTTEKKVREQMWVQSQIEKAKMERDLMRAAEIKRQLDFAKPMYEELDAIVVRVNAAMGKSKTMEVGGTVFTVVDNFESKNTVFRPCGVKRFELVVETALEHQEGLAKAARKAQKAGGK